jgi:endonuclease G
MRPLISLTSLTSFTLGILLSASASVPAQPIPAACTPMVKAIGAPRYKGDAAEHQHLCREGYVLSHNAERKTPDWVVERLTPKRFSGPGDRDAQGNPFAADPDLPDGKRAKPSDYKKSGFDQGHMAPAASMKFSKKATEESFYMSNMSPQVGIGLNRHIWADLEELTRHWTCERGELIVITGPLYDDENPKTIGANDVAVPTAFYKIAYDPKKRRVITFVLPNEKVDKKGKKAWDALKPFISTLREVEERAGLDFLAAIPKREQSRLETMKSVMWPVLKKCGDSE